MPDLACVFLINTTGCLVQRDRLELDVMVGSRAQAQVTTQSATKSHAMDANHAAAFDVVRKGAATRARQPRHLSPATQALGRETDFLENPGPRWVGGGETFAIQNGLATRTDLLQF